jgi:hypothetical protein
MILHCTLPIIDKQTMAADAIRLTEFNMSRTQCYLSTIIQKYYIKQFEAILPFRRVMLTIDQHSGVQGFLGSVAKVHVLVNNSVLVHSQPCCKA